MEDTKRAPRRSHSAELKARVLGECSQQGASIAKAEYRTNDLELAMTAAARFDLKMDAEEKVTSNS